MLENALWLCYHMLRQKMSYSEIKFHKLKTLKERATMKLNLPKRSSAAGKLNRKTLDKGAPSKSNGEAFFHKSKI